MLSRSIEAVNRRYSAVSLWCEPVMIGIVGRCLLRCFKNSVRMQKCPMECVSYAFTFCSLVFQTACIGRKRGICEESFIHYERAFDAGCKRQTGRATGVTRRAESIKERTTAMNYFKLLVPKTLWLGIGIATILLGWTPSCKAQEVSPVRFTDTGVEDVYPAKPPAKKPAKVRIATQSAQAVPSSQPIGRKQNTHRAARKRNVVFAPGM